MKTEGEVIILDLSKKFVEYNNYYLYLLIDNSDKIKLFVNYDDNIQKFQIEKINYSSSSTSIISTLQNNIMKLKILY